jgi:DNA-binding CsgD family transcriptional regulator
VAANLDFQAISGIDIPPHYGVEAFLRKELIEPKQALDLATLWYDLINGKWFARSGFCSETECFLVLEQRHKPSSSRPPPAHVVSMVEQVLTGESQKALAIDASLSRSTVATRCAGCLRGIGNEHTLSCVPTLILIAAHAARGMKLASATVRQVTGTENQRWLVSYERPDSALASTLSEAEREVVRLLVEGRTHTQIAQARITSPRTIANQLGASFRKLGVSGRTALIATLLRAKASPTNADSEQRLH